MKNITKHLMPRYVWFMIWFKQWFKNPEGIKGFATQAMNWLMQRTMALAERLKNVNKKLAGAIKTKNALLLKWYEHATVDADEWDKVKGTVRKLGLWVFVGVATEAACNYFAVESIMEGKGWFWIAIRTLVAVGITGLCIYFFEKWFAVIINKPAYKQVLPKQRNWIELIALTFICVGFEIAFYWLCKRRSIVLEGKTSDETITNFVTLFGMLLPIGAGYLAYERSRYLSAYKNTLRIAKAEKVVAKKESTIATNNQKMEDHFKRELQDTWAVLDEFKTYKENYNLKCGINNENLAGHFCETHEHFKNEAMQRYTKDVLEIVPEKPTLVVLKGQVNGNAKELPQYIINSQNAI